MENELELHDELNEVIGETAWAYAKLILLSIAFCTIITLLGVFWDSIWNFFTRPFNKKDDSKKSDKLDKEFDV